MAVRLLLVPIETGPAGHRGPKYFQYKKDPDPPALIQSVSFAMMDFGLEPTALLAADLTPAQITTLSGLPDVTLIPANLDNQLGANLGTVQSELEAMNIPADILTTNNTYRQVLRGVIAIFSLAQRFYFLRGIKPEGARLFPAGITLETPLNQVSAGVRSDLQEAAAALNYNYDGITLASTFRDVLKLMATQPAPVRMLEVDI